MERTLLIIKPDAVEAGHTGTILARMEEEGFHIRAVQKRIITRREADEFYDIHREKPFFGGLMEFMCSGPVVLCVLEGTEVVTRLRHIVGSTDPEAADEGTIRRQFGSSIRKNAVHASDSPENGERETRFFFPLCELL